jgi:hypothetical protein
MLFDGYIQIWVLFINELLELVERNSVALFMLTKGRLV